MPSHYLLHIYRSWRLTFNHKRLISSCLISTLLSINCWANPSVDQIIKAVEHASQTRLAWDGPTQGPSAVHAKKVIFVAADLRNGGIHGVAKGVTEATNNIGWQLRFIDAKGSADRQAAALHQAILAKPDGIILGGFDAHQHAKTLQTASALGISVAGWHASGVAGPDKNTTLFTNLTTHPHEVAKLAAYYAIASTNGQAKVVIFTDPNYVIAQAKSDVMVDVIKRCNGCELLGIENIPLENAASQMPTIMNRLLDEYATTITHFLVINDLYIDFAVPSIENSELPERSLPMSISAGDGSEAAYARIQNNHYQVATVSEPLTLHGWQLIDELNRAFNQQPNSGFSASPSLITTRNIQAHQSMNHTALSTTAAYASQFKAAYRSIWQGGQSQ